MLPSRKLLRREFLHVFPFKTFAIANELFYPSKLPKRKFQLGDYVISKRVCDDHLFSNYGGWDWESGFVIGYCWNYDEWLDKNLQCGWTYFVRFDKTNYSNYLTEPWIDFEHEMRLEIT